jgi:hypothetical protein
MQTPKEKADELYYRYNRQLRINERKGSYTTLTQGEKDLYTNRNNSLLCCIQILKELQTEREDRYLFWEQVRKELEKLWD